MLFELDARKVESACQSDLPSQRPVMPAHQIISGQSPLCQAYSGGDEKAVPRRLGASQDGRDTIQTKVRWLRRSTRLLCSK